MDSSETTRRSPLSRKIIKAYMQGALHDATLNKNKRFRFSQSNIGWLVNLKQLLASLDYRSWIYKEGKYRNVYVLETVAKFLDFGFNPLILKESEEIAAYICGFFDAEGGIPCKLADRFYIQLVQKDKNKLEKIKFLLEKLDISSGKIHNPSKKIDPNYWRLFVRSNSYIRFIERVGSWHPRKSLIFTQRMKIWSMPVETRGQT